MKGGRGQEGINDDGENKIKNNKVIVLKEKKDFTLIISGSEFSHSSSFA